MKITIPFVCGQLNKKNEQALLRKLKQFDADEVFICFFKTMSPKSTDITELKQTINFLKANGYKVAVWETTLLQRNITNRAQEYARSINADGEERKAVCPLCEKYSFDYCEIIKDIARAGTNKIVLDDDFRMQFPRAKACCFCEEHLKLYGSILGKSVTREEMKQKLFEEQDKEYREAWIKGCQFGLEKMATAIRRVVDEVDDTIEIMLCAGPTHFGGDGTDPYKLAKILKSKEQKDELRIIGAPYWQTHGYTPNNMTAYDFARHQMHEAKKRNYYIVGEGDPHPRLRYATSAAELEFYHTLLLADGNCDRLMKYGFNYISTFNYEDGYAEFHEYNKHLYGQIKELFKDKELTGFYLVEPFDNLHYAETIYNDPDSEAIWSETRQFAVDLSLPISFEPGGVNLILGQRACNIDKSILKNGTIIDITAAQLLEKQGIDVGIKSAQAYEGDLQSEVMEYYTEFDDVARLGGRLVGFKNLTLAKNAVVESTINIAGMDYVFSYRYENADGQRFLVLNVSTRMLKSSNFTDISRNYYRQKQIVNNYEWLNGKELDAICLGNPDLYIMTKKNDTALAIGLWNHFSDKILKPTIRLNKNYKSVKFINCEGRMENREIVLTKPLGAYEFCFIELMD